MGKEKSDKEFLSSTLLSLVQFIKSKNPKLNLAVSFDSSKYSKSEIDTNFFFKLGQLCMFLYIMNISNKKKEDIRYVDGKFLLDFDVSILSLNYKKKMVVEDIVNYVIRKSTYNKECLVIEELGDISKDNLAKIEEGFNLTYRTFIDEKTELTRFLSKHDTDNKYVNLIRDINILNPHDLKIQLQLIKVKLCKKLDGNKIVEKLRCCIDNYSEFIEVGENLSNILIENSTIAINDGKMELMWIAYIEKNIKPIGYRNIYIALLFSYIGKKTGKKYILQAAQNSVRPLLDNIRYSSLNLGNESIGEDYEMIKSLYLLNNYIEYNELDVFIRENKKIFSYIETKEIKCYQEGENLILKCIKDKSLDVLSLLVLNNY